MYYVDIPKANADGEMENVGTFDTKAEAIAFAQQEFGADEQGNICLVSFTQDDEGEDTDAAV